MILLLLLLASTAPRADVLHLKDGSKIKGEVTRMDGTEVTIVLPYGTLAVKRADVAWIDLGDEETPPAAPAPPAEKEAEEDVEIPGLEPVLEPDSSQSLGPPLEPPKPKQMKSPSSAAMLAVIPGGGYAYLERWDLALGAAGLELGLAGLGLSLVSDEGEGKNSTGYVILGFLGLLKVAEILDSRDRAEEWNRLLREDVGGDARGGRSARAGTATSGETGVTLKICSFRIAR